MESFHKEKRRKFLCSDNAHPQTTAIVKTRCDALGIKFEIFDGSKDVFDGKRLLSEEYDLSKYCGILVHYPDTHGNVDNLESIVNQAKNTETIVVVATDLLALTMVKPPGEYGKFCDIAIGTAQRFGRFPFPPYNNQFNLFHCYCHLYHLHQYHHRYHHHHHLMFNILLSTRILTFSFV